MGRASILTTSRFIFRTHGPGKSGLATMISRPATGPIAEHHRDQMDYQHEKGHFDRSSFTRARIVSSKGGWDGGDPVLELS